ncbi:MAG: asparagine synthase (glutamine-hydrolyzing) [Ectothiorhodospiraceae bacterium]|nr:asparagine synthase (glutamine-hydrolyzing) [Chromatiales bacterium]MCP5155634.1 asparagine synthase (glutamine-hydrolyzing) [Ectothiorhodospiraceae bacterium]
MCGFAGFLDLRRRIAADELAPLARRMSEAIRSRGPDDAAEWTERDAGYAVGFRRLAIIDLSEAGRQPMHSSDGRYVIAYNGEVYNGPALRAELEREGSRFRGHSDTEVILEACVRWGLDAALARFVGMFAIALWDRLERRVTLIRDRMGIKPLYFGEVGGTVLFGSQPKAFFAHPHWRAEIDPESFALYSHFSYVPAPRSIYRRIEQVLPGHLVTIDTDGQVTRRCYWDLHEVARAGLAAPLEGDDATAVDALDAALRDAVRLRMIADVPLGAFLSGGVDSSAVVALMQAQSDRPVKTFSIGFAEAGYDEAPHARAVAEHLGTEHHELYVSPQHALDLVPRIGEWYDEPFADSSQLPTYLVSELTRQHVTVSLSGDGGDELFSGYPRYGHAERLIASLGGRSRLTRAATRMALRAIPVGVWDLAGRALPGRFRREGLGARSRRLASMLENGTPEDLYRGLVCQWHESSELVPRERLALDAPWSGALAALVPDLRRRFQLVDMLTYLPNDILAKVDRASMAVSLEARVPLLDHRVVELSWRLPARMSVRDGVEKWILREVLYRHVPRALIERPKMGFGVPIDSWLRGPLREWAEDLLDPRTLGADGLFDPAPVRERWAQHQRGEASWHYPLWTILMFQDWKRRWGVA